MSVRRLEQRFREKLDALQVSLDADSVHFAVDFTMAVVQSLWLAAPRKEELDALLKAVHARTGLDERLTWALVEMALSPEFRSIVDEQELRAFAARFGAEAAEGLRTEGQEDFDLAAYGRRYQEEGSLLLLDTLFAIAASDGAIRPTEVQRLTRAAAELCVDPVLVTALLQKHDPRQATGELRFPLRADRLVLGRSASCDIALADPQVAERHAELVRVGSTWRVVDLGSGRPTVVGGSAVSSAPVDATTPIKLGPYSLRLEGEELVVKGERSFSALSVRRLKRQIGAVSLLDDVSFTVFTGEVVALVGPSGCGKTTLLNAINGVAPADSGEVLLDGQDFHRLLELDRSLVGIVPQDDLVNPELSVEESLSYSARLRFPPDVKADDVQAEVERVLGELDIAHIRKSRIGDALNRGISGGQRKRVNLGQELLTRSTRVLFLDEPTSGLDPRASQDIVRLVRQLADAGRIVFLVTHDLTPEVISKVDHLLVLAKGGRVAYFGSPPEACRWFGVSTPDAIFNRFGDYPPEEWGRRYREGTAYRKYVGTREHLAGIQGVRRSTDQGGSGRRSLISQLITLASRQGRVKLRDRTGLFVLAIQPVVLAIVMGVVFEAPSYPMLFMLSLSALWFGMSASVRELISDRVIWQRERRVGVSVLAYIGSKVLVLGLIIAVQCIFLAAVLYFACGMADYGFSLPLLSMVTLMVGHMGMATGLLVSAVWTSSEAAVGTLPVLLIPQITFSSVMVSIRDMGPLAKGLTWLTLERYAFDAVIKSGQNVAITTYKRGEWKQEPTTGTLWKLGLKLSDSADDVGLSLPALLGILGGSTALLLLAATLVVALRGRKAS